MLSIV